MPEPREIEGVCSEFLTGFVNVCGAIFLAPFVFLIVLHSFTEAFEVSRLVPRVQISNRIFEQVVDVLVPQIVGQFVARCVAVSFLSEF